jgi:anti-sigma factor RsiW
MNDHASLSPRDGDDASYAWLDEWLCEYVDGTMDPSLEAVFETYVEANPDLKAHIEQLNETREMLGHSGKPAPPSRAKRRRVCNRVQSRVCRKVECDMLRQQSSFTDLVRDHSRAALGIASSMAVALVVGIFTGALLFGAEADPAARTVSTARSAVSTPGSTPGPSGGTQGFTSPAVTAMIPASQAPMSTPDPSVAMTFLGSNGRVGTTYDFSTVGAETTPVPDREPVSATPAAEAPPAADDRATFDGLTLPLDGSELLLGSERGMTPWPGPAPTDGSTPNSLPYAVAGWSTISFFPAATRPLSTRQGDAPTSGAVLSSRHP